jgi:hypothetical protein
MAATGAEVLVGALVDAGVEVCFANPGEHLSVNDLIFRPKSAVELSPHPQSIVPRLLKGG